MTNRATAMPDDDFFRGGDEGDDRVEVESVVVQLGPTASEPLRGLRYLGPVAVVGRARLVALASAPAAYVWKDIAVRGTIVLLASGPSEGKTTLLMLVLTARANTSTLPIWLLEREIRPATPGKYIVLIEGEHTEPSAARKLLESAKMLRVDDRALDRIIMVARKAVRLGSPEWGDVVKLIAAGLVSDLAIDTIARVAPGDADDERSQVAIFDLVAQAIEAAPRPEDRPTVWAAAHTRKNGTSGDLADVSGSAQRTGQADTVLMLKGEKIDGRTVSTRVVFAKLREDPDEYPTPVTFAISRGADGAKSLRIVGDEGDDRPLEARITEQLTRGKTTKTALATTLKRSHSDVDVAIGNLFAARAIRTTSVVVAGRSRKAFALAFRAPDEAPDSGSSDENTRLASDGVR